MAKVLFRNILKAVSFLHGPTTVLSIHFQRKEKKKKTLMAKLLCVVSIPLILTTTTTAAAVVLIELGALPNSVASF